jgi:hypothetical protein
MTTTFSDQLTATRTNLERLEKLFAKHPALFEHASFIEVTPNGVQVYIHASGDRDRDWKAWVRQHPANWQRKWSASNGMYWDYRGEIDGVAMTVLQAELQRTRRV